MKKILTLPLIFACIFLFYNDVFIKTYFKTLTGDELLFFIQMPIKGADKQLISIYMINCLIKPFVYSVLICYIKEIISFIKIMYQKYYTSFIVFICLITFGCFMIAKFNFLKDIIRIKNAPYDTFFEKHYVEPKAKNVIFKQKKNLIIISVESLEKTFENKQFFGQSLLPHLEKLEKEGVQFSNYINGPYTTCTVASNIALFTGLPIMTHNNVFNKYGHTVRILDSYYSLGNYLEDNGYQTYVIQGTSGQFAGHDYFFKTHGIQYFMDRNMIRSILRYNFNTIPPQEDTWGYNDEVVFDFSKKIISKISSNIPYFLFIQTIDTHANYLPMIGEYKAFNNKYFNTIHHTSLLIYNFILWLKKQPEYDNTVIVIIGDHLRMDGNFAMPIKRQIYNLFLNTTEPPSTERTFSQIDLFPTILEALGANVKDHQLGLGISVFSSTKTLLEQFPDSLKDKMTKRSKLLEEIWKN